MSGDLSRAAAMRQEFDRAFATEPVRETARWTEFLAIGAGGVPHAIRAAEVAGLHRFHRITPVPSPAPSLLGLLGFRGIVVPVHGLSRLLGVGSDADAAWCVLVGREEPVALAFDVFHGQFRLGHEDQPGTAAKAMDRHVTGVVPFQGRHVPVVDVASVVAALRAGVRQETREETR